ARAARGGWRRGPHGSRRRRELGGDQGGRGGCERELAGRRRRRGRAAEAVGERGRRLQRAGARRLLEAEAIVERGGGQRRRRGRLVGRIVLRHRREACREGGLVQA